MSRDISFDEEVAERSDAHRKAFGEPAPLADLLAGQRKIAAEFDAAASRSALAITIVSARDLAIEHAIARGAVDGPLHWSLARRLDLLAREYGWRGPSYDDVVADLHARATVTV